jgi:hypothetical protein
MVRKFLFEQTLGQRGLRPRDFDVEDWPTFVGWFSVYASAKAIFHSPSDLAGPHGMHREVIRSTPLWYRSYERRDTVLVQVAGSANTFGGMAVGRVIRFLKFAHAGITYDAALLEWFDRVSDAPHPVTGMWEFAPSQVCGLKQMSIVRLDSIFRGCHLIPKYGTTFVREKQHFSHTLLSFRTFFLNHYVDYHACETTPRQ